MPGLNRHSKLVTPNQLLAIALLGIAGSVWFFEIPVEYHLERFGATMRELIRFVFGGR